MCYSSLYALAQSWDVWDVCVVPRSADQTLSFERPLFSVLSNMWMLDWPQNWAHLLPTGEEVSAEACFGSLASLGAVEVFLQ